MRARDGLRFRRPRSGRLAATAAALACLLLAATARDAASGLSSADRDTLLRHLPIIAACGGNPESWDACNPVFADPAYDAADFEAFFANYFAARRLTACLYTYYRNHAFWWHTAPIRRTHQLAWTGVITTITDDALHLHGNGIAVALAADSTLRAACLNGATAVHDILIAAGSQLTAAETARFDSLQIAWVRDVAPGVLAKSSTLEPDLVPYVVPFRSQLYASLVDIYPLDASRKELLRTTINLGGLYETLWNEHGLLVIDDNKLDAQHMLFLEAFFDALDPELHGLTIITVRDEWYVPGQEGMLWSARDDINLYQWLVGTPVGNPFPPDIAPSWTDGSEVVTEEVANAIDDTYVASHPELAARRARLIEDAGGVPMQYLQSTFEDSFFVRNPGAFFPETARQWFCDSEHTLRLGAARFRIGFERPIDQALFFARVFVPAGAAAAGADSTIVFRIDETGEVASHRVPILRDGAGEVAAVRGVETIVFCDIDADGRVANVADYAHRAPAPRVFTAHPRPGAVRLVWTNPDTASAEGTLVVYRNDRYPWGPADGTPVENGAGGIFRLAPGSKGDFLHEGLEAGIEYLYRAFTVTGSDRSWPAEAAARPTTPVEITHFEARAEGDAVVLEWRYAEAADHLGFHVWRGDVEAGDVEAGGVEAGGAEAGDVEAGGAEAGGAEAGGAEAGDVEAGGAVDSGDEGSTADTDDDVTGHPAAEDRRLTAELLRCDGSCVYVDRHARPGRLHRYRLEDVDRSGASTFSAPVIVRAMEAAPAAAPTLALDAAFPSPYAGAGGSLEIVYTVPVAGTVDLAIYDATGRLARRLVGDWREAGTQRTSWDGTTASGRQAASGVYVCRLEVGGRAVSRKLIITR